MSTPHKKYPRRGGPRRFVVILGLAFLVAGVEHFADRVSEPTASWIWADSDHGTGDPIAFYAVRELELDTVAQARLAITADDTYVLYVNGQRVGAGHYRPGSGLDEYEVEDYLEAGANRLVIEARSSRGAGGLIAELDLGQGNPAIVTDGSWRIFRRYDPGLFGGWEISEVGEAPKIWGRPPTGRWRLSEERRQRPISSQGFPPPERQRPLRHKALHKPTWLELDSSLRRIPALGPQQIFDWGEVVEGVVSFNLRSDEGKPGLLFASNEPPDVTDISPDAVIVPVPGRRFWQDTKPRRFRYLLLVGVEPYSRIEVDVVDGEVHDPAAPALTTAGVFGFEPPRSYSKVEEEVWERLEDEADLED